MCYYRIILYNAILRNYFVMSKFYNKKRHPGLGRLFFIEVGENYSPAGSVVGSVAGSVAGSVELPFSTNVTYT